MQFYPARERSHLQMTIRVLKRDRAALLGGAVFLLIVAATILAPVLAPFDPYDIRPEMRLAPPGTMQYLLGGDELGQVDDHDCLAPDARKRPIDETVTEDCRYEGKPKDGDPLHPYIRTEPDNVITGQLQDDGNKEAEQARHQVDRNDIEVNGGHLLVLAGIDQIEGIEAPVEEQTTYPFAPIEQAELIIRNMPNKPVIKYGGSSASYSPMLDSINLPDRESFISPEEFYCTAFHELAHSTGHPSRLSRKGITDPAYFGSHNYSNEELVAEFSASMLCGIAGIEQQTIENSMERCRR